MCVDVSLTEWGSLLKTQLGGRRCPLGATFELTQRCNLNCVHCYINGSGGLGSGNNQELSLDEINRILDQMAGAGVVNLLLTGGEVFLRLDFLDIYRYAKGLGMLVMVFTNSTLLTEQAADFLAE
jgi:MoaA/NifB/PqqE/SkfB family radical SAM enzyme